MCPCPNTRAVFKMSDDPKDFCPLFSVTTERSEWIDRAEGLRAQTRIAHQRGRFDRGRRRKAGPLAFIPDAPTIHLEAESNLHRSCAEAFHICGGRWADCADAYASAAAVQARCVRCPESAAALYAEAGEVLEREDPIGAVKHYGE